MTEQMVPEQWGAEGGVRMRIAPRLPPGAFRSFTILAPVSTHFRPATCEEVRCEQHVHGWATTVETAGPQDHYIRRESGRSFTVEVLPGGLTRFTFEPGQACFRSGDHKVRLEREEIYVARAGDWRGTDGDVIRHSGSADWVDEFATLQDRWTRAVERG